MKLALALLALAAAAEELEFGAACDSNDDDCVTDEVCCTMESDGETEYKFCLDEDDSTADEDLVNTGDSDAEYSNNSCYEEDDDEDDDAATALYAGAAALAVAASLF